MLSGPPTRSGFPPPSGRVTPPRCSLFLLRRSHPHLFPLHRGTTRRVGPDPVGEGRSLDQLQNERLGVLRLLDAVDGGDARMVEAGEDLRFPLEPGEAVRVSRKGVGQDLQRDIAMELGVGGLIDLSDAPLADEGGDVVVPEAVTDGQGRRSIVLYRSRSAAFFAAASRARSPARTLAIERLPS